jgi:hypothetical protein
MPELYIITGSNGADKPSVGPEYLPLRVREQVPFIDLGKSRAIATSQRC